MPSSTSHRRGGAATGRAAIPVPKRGPDFSDSYMYPGVDLWPEKESTFLITAVKSQQHTPGGGMMHHGRRRTVVPSRAPSFPTT